MTLFVERRRPALTGELLLHVALAWAMISALLLVTNLGAILAHRFPDPDDTLRLVQVRDFIGGQGWFDVVQHRAGQTPMHWSRLVDLPIAGVIMALRGLIGQPAAELAALIVVPLVTLFVCLFLIGRIAWRIMGGELAMFACLAFAFCVPVVEQLRPMRIDHHGWQIAAVLFALNGMMARSARVGGWMIGGALAFGLTISIEGLPMAAAFMAVLGLRWARSRADRQWLISAMQSLTAISAGLYLLTHGLNPAIAACDAITPLHLGIFGWCALVVSAGAALEPQPRAALLAILGLAGAGSLGIVLQVAPQCAGGAFSAVDPLVRSLWLDQIQEGMPIWHQAVPRILQTLLPPVIAISATIKLAGRSSSWLRLWWIDYAMLLGAAFAISIFVARAGAVAGALAAIPLGWHLREWLRGARYLKRPMKKVFLYGGMAVALVPAAPALLLVSAVPGQAQISAGNGHAPKPGQCGNSTMPATLAALPAGKVLAPIEVAPLILLDTRHQVLATGHHRAPLLATVIRAFMSDEHRTQAITAHYAVDYVALCPTVAEPQNYAHQAPDGFAAQLLSGRQPAWLERVPPRANDGWLVWRVRQPGPKTAPQTAR
jgi:hypothetical protein